MRKSTFSKMILPMFLTGCISVTAVGCGQSTESDLSSNTSDAKSIVSSTQSIDDAGNLESTENTYSELGSNNDDLESKTDKSGDKSDKTESQTDESIISCTETESQSDELASQTDESENQVIKKSEENSGDIVVVLDPGHDDKDDRENPELGVNEQILNLKIGIACYKRLSEYEGITPYLTRYDEVCPNTDGMFTGESECIHRRAYIAEEKNADFFISLHCNASTGELGAEANGISVYVTNYPKYRDECERLGNMIIDHVTSAVDLGSMGVILSEQNEDKGYYDDGTVKDKYYLLSYNIDYGRPSVIVEHAFMDNINDNAILKDDEKLKLIGQADADAIAEYYGLKLKLKPYSY